ncbi:MAG: acyl--CoA ligase [Candidatus Omnitrophica bacterium]|jgi:long-chain acyl-CoA synthetase|nr:acyl--CoA ligase [Candidatus Omnitrophota bacterium]
MDIKDLLLKQADKNSQKTALIFEDKQFNFWQVKDITFRLANYFLAAGLTKGERIAIYLPNNPQALFSFLGSFSIGLTVVPLDFMLTQEEVINFINHSQAKVLITQPKKEINLAQIEDSCPSLDIIIISKEKVEEIPFWDEIISEYKSDTPYVKLEPQDAAAIFYTSGSTGHPKGVLLDYAHLDNPSQIIDYFLKVTAKDVFLCGGVPFSHIGGLDYILLMVNFASTLVLMERFQPLEFLKNIQSHKVTIFCIVPAMYVAILSLKEYDKFDLSSLRYAVVFGAPSSEVLLKRFHKAYPRARLSNGWGMTETAAPNTLLSPDSDNISSIGKFTADMEVKIVNEQENSLGPEERGELWVRGRAVMKEYYQEKELTRQVLTPERWLKTGDIAYYDRQGFFYIVGRKKEMIKVAGEIVFLAEVEEKIRRYPKIKEVAVVGVPDSLRGEVPKAFIVTEEAKLDEQKLKEFLKIHLAHFKIPHYFEVVKDLPRNRTGKVDKLKLVQSS